MSPPPIGVRAIGARGLRSPSRMFEIAIFGQKKKSGNIRVKPLDFRASNGKHIRARNFSPLTKLVPYAYAPCPVYLWRLNMKSNDNSSKMSWTLDKYTLSLKVIRYLIICNEKAGIYQILFKTLYPWRVCKTWKLKVYFAILMGMYRNEISFGRWPCKYWAHNLTSISHCPHPYNSKCPCFPAPSPFFCSQVAMFPNPSMFPFSFFPCLFYQSRNLSLIVSHPMSFRTLCLPPNFHRGGG